MPWFRITPMLVLALTAHVADAQWVPQWLGTWQHPEPFRGASPADLRVAADGTVFAAIDVTHHGRAHAALARFDADGNFVWLREHEAPSIAAIELLAGGRVVLVGDSATAGMRIFVRVYDGASGNIVWQRESNLGRLGFDERRTTRHLAVDANGNLLVLANDGGDFVVIRYDADGNALPSWRYASGDETVTGSYVIALPDGGAIVTGQGHSLGGGYKTVRFDAQGGVLFVDTMLGDIGNPLGPSYLAPADDGGFVVAGAPESSFGVPEAQVWKLAADGARAWTTVIPNPHAPSSLDIGAFAALPNGDVLVAAADVIDTRFRLVRIDRASGAVLRDSTATIGGTPTTLTLAPNGRGLVGGFTFANSSGTVTARIVEFDANGAPCRLDADLAMFSGVAASPGADSWTVLGGSAFVAGTGNDAFALRYDATGVCTVGDAIFANGFETVVRKPTPDFRAPAPK